MYKLFCISLAIDGGYGVESTGGGSASNVIGTIIFVFLIYIGFFIYLCFKGEDENAPPPMC